MGTTISASSTLHIGPTSFEIAQRDDGKAQVNTDWVVLGNIIAENYIVSSYFEILYLFNHEL